MKHIGYGKLRDGKPCGIWPSTHSVCSADIHRLVASDKEERKGPHVYEIVEIHISAPVRVLPKPSPTELQPGPSMVEGEARAA